ncbi:MAG: hypothetical protein Fur0037_23550 [Planctomycetota bacterium]
MDRFEDVKLRVKEASDLVSLIESHLPLRRRGRTMVALCPFHEERSPSFTVFPETQHFHCFGCGKTGDVFTWLMEREGLAFREAMERLADAAGISTEGVFHGSGRERGKGPDPHKVLGEVRAFFQMALQSGEGRLARDYLEARGLSEAIEPWSIGYHPFRPRALAEFAERRELSRSVLEAAGLVRASGREPFAGRIVFPIEDERGRTVGFGGRLIPGGPGSERAGDFEPPKYLNSPESPFFNKRRVLFGLKAARTAGIRRLLVVEGYVDVIACHLAGFRGAVAPLGTAFTKDHARAVERFAEKGVVLLFDSDRAGRAAMERALGELWDTRLSLRVAFLEGGKDPGEVLLAAPGEDPEVVARRREGFGQQLESAQDALSAFFKLLRERLDLSDPARLEEAAGLCAGILSSIGEKVRRDGLLQRMAAHLGIPAEGLSRLLARRARTAARRDRDTGQGAKARPDPARAESPTERADLDLLACALRAPELLLHEDAKGRDAFGSLPPTFPPVVELLGLVREGLASGRQARPELVRYLFSRCAGREDLFRLLAAADRRAESIARPDDFRAELMAGRLRLATRRNVRETRQRLQEAMAAGDRAAADSLTEQLLKHLRLGHGKSEPDPSRAPSPVLPAIRRPDPT